jgi:uncharacterized protein (DUF433 family)
VLAGELRERDSRSRIANRNKRYQNRDVNRKDRISVDSAILTGKPVIKGTRIAVEFVIDLLAQGSSEPEILRNYPD